MKRSAQEVQAWLIGRISQLTGMAPEEVNPTQPVLHYGLDSVAIVALITDMEVWLGYKIRGNPIEDNPTIASLAEFLAEQQAPTP